MAETASSQGMDHFASFNRDAIFNDIADALRPMPPIRDRSDRSLTEGLQTFICTFRKASKQGNSEIGTVGLLNALAPFLSSCLLLYAERNNLPDDAAHLFRQRFLRCLTVTFWLFAHSLACAFERRGRRCRNLQSTHAKGHRGDDGRLMGTTPFMFEANFDPDRFLLEWTHLIEQGLGRAQRALLLRARDHQHLSRRAVAALIHRDEVIRLLPWIKHPADFASYRFCLFCACHGGPQHILPCGHVLCTTCVETFHDGSANDGLEARYAVRCPFHPHEQAQTPAILQVKPAGAGLRILCLDGGGIRGIVQLAILDKIEAELGGELPIQAFFDLVVGTSTGGINALRLFAQNAPLSECVKDFKSMCSHAFILRTASDWIKPGSAESLYKTRPFNALLRKVFGEDDLLLVGKTALDTGCFAKVAVTSTKMVSGKLRPVLVANYNRPDDRGTASQYGFLRSGEGLKPWKTWEAAQASSAAFPVFTPFVKDKTSPALPLLKPFIPFLKPFFPFLKPFVKNKTGLFFDGGYYNNNPAKVALAERRLLWDDVADSHPDILLSLGTGHSQADAGIEVAVTPTYSARTSSFLGTVTTVIGNIIRDQLACENAWNDTVEMATALCSNDRELTSRYIRLDVDVPGRVPRLDEVKRVGELESLVLAQESNGEKEVAHRLIASCFFSVFQRAVPETSGTMPLVVAQLRCRFNTGSAQLKAVGRKFRRLRAQGFQPLFQVQPDYKPRNENRPDELPEQRGTPFPISDATIAAMCEDGHFSMSVGIALPLSPTTVRISVALQEAAYMSHGSRFLSISGFPRSVDTTSTLESQHRGAGHSVYAERAPPSSAELV